MTPQRAAGQRAEFKWQALLVAGRDTLLNRDLQQQANPNPSHDATLRPNTGCPERHGDLRSRGRPPTDTIPIVGAAPIGVLIVRPSALALREG